MLDVKSVELPEGKPWDDPLASLAAIASGDGGDYVLLHSGPAAGYSVLGFDPLCQVIVDGDGRAAVRSQLAGMDNVAADLDALEALQNVVERIDFAAPQALVGWLGFVAYDVGKLREGVGTSAADELRWPRLWFTLFRHYLLFESDVGRTRAFALTAQGDTQSPRGWERFSNTRAPTAFGNSNIVEQQPQAAYEAKIKRVKEYIAAGDIYQANLAQRWVVETQGTPEEVFRRLCGISPAPYAACLRITEGGITRHVVSASPELFLAVQDGRIITRPIKGTRPRDQMDADRDLALREELVASAKDRAELTMIVDLLRNDLGRVSEYGSVRVVEPRAVEQHPTVWHTVATIESRLRKGVGVAEILAALCPGGSITGAPKIRAMQIIQEREGFPRGVYCGNVGVLGPRGSTMGLNIAIRTIAMQQGRAYVYAGGGIVADSDPGREYEETLHKASAMLRALGVT